jgi:hypothetical protein
MEGGQFRDVEEALERHARRLAGEFGKLLIGVGEALRDEAGKGAASEPMGRQESTEPTREDLYREATRLGVKGRSSMSKEQLKDAVAKAR